MASEYREIKNTNSQKSFDNNTEKEVKILGKAFYVFCVLAIVLCIISACLFFHNNIYKGNGEWVILHDVIGTYGDFIGGFLGTFVALFSAYLLFKTLRSQIAVNRDVIDTNKTTVYQTYRQIIDNNYHMLFDNYQDAILSYHNKYNQTGGVVKETSFKESGKEAIDLIAASFYKVRFSDNRPYLSRVKKATVCFDEFYSRYRREMSVHFRTLYLLAKFIGELECEDVDGNIQLTEDDRVWYAKSLRGQLSDGELLLLRYNCLTARGEKMRGFVNQFNLTKHLPIMSLLEFQRHRQYLPSDRDASTLDAHFITLRKMMKDLFVFGVNELTGKITLSAKYSIQITLNDARNKMVLKLSIKKQRPKTGSDGTPTIEKALNCFSIDALKELYKDFCKEVFLTSNFYLFNNKDDTTIQGDVQSDSDFDFCIVAVEKKYRLVISPDQIAIPS